MVNKIQIKDFIGNYPDLVYDGIRGIIAHHFYKFCEWEGYYKRERSENISDIWDQFVKLLRTDEYEKVVTKMSETNYNDLHYSANHNDYNGNSIKLFSEADTRDFYQRVDDEREEKEEAERKRMEALETAKTIKKTKEKQDRIKKTINKMRGKYVYAADGRKFFEIETQKEIMRDIQAAGSFFFNQNSKSSVVPFRGFLIEGVPGTGKTALVKEVAHRLDLEFNEESNLSVGIVVVDGGDIAAPKWGEAEQKLKEIFRRARESDDFDKTIILFDDIDTFLFGRGSKLAREFHVSLNGMFFHELDTLDVSRILIVGTTNKIGHIDDAIRSRLFTYTMDSPKLEELMTICEEYVDSLGISRAFLPDLRKLLENIHKQENRFPTMRDLENYFNQFLLREFRKIYDSKNS